MYKILGIDFVFLDLRCYCDFICIPGKVHGSLARAGKVKGQTPKVSNCLRDLAFHVLVSISKFIFVLISGGKAR